MGFTSCSHHLIDLLFRDCISFLLLIAKETEKLGRLHSRGIQASVSILELPRSRLTWFVQHT